jgi:hypothetical protein
MSFRLSSRLLTCGATLSLAVGFAACSPVPGEYRAWNGPGWYLERPYLIVAGGPQYLGGPYTYDQCEDERQKRPADVRGDLLCNRENRRPDRYGFF